MPAPKIAIAPEPWPDWVRDAVLEAGGEVVPANEASGLVWTDPRLVAPLRDLLDRSPSVQWVQLPWAGVEDFASVGMFDDGRTWTCGKGVYAEPVAEHALGLALAGLRELPERLRAQSWGPQSGVSLFDQKVTILGGGGITECLVDLLKPFRVEVTVVRRSDDPFPGADLTVGRDGLLGALADARVVFVALALTPETERIIGAPELRAMRPDAWLVNVARGRHVETAALVTALRGGWIAGAALDVTDPEPLPDGHPLWSLPNAIITPHVGNTRAMAVPYLTKRITENVRRFGNGEPLLGPVEPRLGY